MIACLSVSSCTFLCLFSSSRWFSVYPFSSLLLWSIWSIKKKQEQKRVMLGGEGNTTRYVSLSCSLFSPSLLSSCEWFSVFRYLFMQWCLGIMVTLVSLALFRLQVCTKQKRGRRSMAFSSYDDELSVAFWFQKREWGQAREDEEVALVSRALLRLWVCSKERTER